MKALTSLFITLIIILSLSLDADARGRKKHRSSKRKSYKSARVVKHKRSTPKRKKAIARAAKRKPAAINDAVSSHVDFDDMMIEGQNKKSSALYFLERQGKNATSRVKLRKHFRNEILESI